MSQTTTDTRQLLEEQGAILERYATEALSLAVVHGLTADRVIAMTNQGLMDIARPQERWGRDLRLGNTILLNEGAIIRVSEHVGYGSITTVSRKIDDNTVEVTADGQPRLVHCAEPVEPGATVCLDTSNRVIVRVLPAVEQRFSVDIPFVGWDEIGGQEEAKREMREAVELPLLHPALFSAYGKKPASGILLFGPPGCGKTKIGKATASALTGRDGGGFMYLKGAEVLDPYVGVAEATVRSVFERARKYREETGQRAVVFVDEADAILGKRGGLHSMMEKTIVPTFLTEMDGLEESGAMVVLSTNRPDTLDAAITRDGRIDRKVKVSRPNQVDASQIFGIYLKDKPLRDDAAALVSAAATALYDPRLRILSLTLSDRSEATFSLQNLSSGAMIEGIVERAVAGALRRDIAAKARNPSGLVVEDMLDAIEQTYRQSLLSEHAEAVTDFADGRAILRMEKHSVAEAA